MFSSKYTCEITKFKNKIKDIFIFNFVNKKTKWTDKKFEIILKNKTET